MQTFTCCLKVTVRGGSSPKILGDIAPVSAFITESIFSALRDRKKCGCQLCNGLDPETHRNEARRVDSGGGFLGRGSEPSPHQLRGPGERRKLPQRSPERIPGKFGFWSILGPQNSRQNGHLAFEFGGQRVNLWGGKCPLSQRRTAPLTVTSFVPQAPEHALFQEHTIATVTEVLLQPDRVCGTACHLTCDIPTLATATSNAN